MKTPHKHAELIKAWADGAIIQEKYSLNDWRVFDGYWQQDDAYSYRIKPEPKPDVVATGILDWDMTSGSVYTASYNTEFRVSERYERDNIKFIFDGETGKLKSAEVL